MVLSQTRCDKWPLPDGTCILILQDDTVIYAINHAREDRNFDDVRLSRTATSYDWSIMSLMFRSFIFLLQLTEMNNCKRK